MNYRQRRFVEAYRGNSTEAARVAGYGEKTAYSQGQRLLKNAEVLAAIRAREQEEDSRLIASRRERQQFWTATMRDGETAMKERLKASELLGKACGDYLTRTEISGPDGGPLEVMDETALYDYSRLSLDEMKELYRLVAKLEGQNENPFQD